MNIKQKAILVFTVCICVLALFYTTNIKTQFTKIEPKTDQFEQESKKEILGTDVDSSDKEIELASQSGVTMYIDPATTNIILKNESGDVISETLPGYAMDENTQSELLSPVMVTYKLDSFSTPVKMFGYEDCIQKGNYTIDIIDNGVKVIYTLGASTISDETIPTYIEKDIYENQILPNTDDEQKNLLRIYYSYSESQEVYSKLGKINPNKVMEMYNIIYTLGGFTEEDLISSNEKYDVETDNSAEPVGFTIPLVYTLDENGDLNVQVLMNEVLISGVNQLISIELLPGFMSTQNGHFLIPDGSGAIIDTSVPKTTKVYSKPFTNIDQEIVGNQVDEVTPGLTLPVFANDNTIAYIDSGAEVSELNVELIGKSKLIYPSINVQYSTFYNFSDEASSAGINLTSEPVDGNYSITYSTATEKRTFYQVVETIQQHYVKQFDLKKSEFSPKLYLYVLGAYDYTDYLAGIPYTSLNTLTTSDDINEMLMKLSAIPRVKVIYDGWNKEGLSSSILTTEAAKINNDVEQLVSSNTNVSLAVNLVRISSTFSSGFNLKVDGAYGVDGKLAEREGILNSSFESDSDKASYYYLAPQYLLSAVDQFLLDFNFGTNIFIKDLGHLGYASFGSDTGVLPIEAEQIVNEALLKFKDAGFEVGMSDPILTRGFMADYIVGLPSTSSGETIFDYTVPFTQLVYSGFIDNTNTSVNLSTSGNIQLEVLHALETQSSIMFTVSGQSSTMLKNTDYDQYYSSNFSYWLDTINKINDEYKEFLKLIDNSEIKNVQIISDGVDVVSYKNDKRVVFNYTDVPVTFENTTVSPLSYKLLEDK